MYVLSHCIHKSNTDYDVDVLNSPQGLRMSKRRALSVCPSHLSNGFHQHRMTRQIVYTTQQNTQTRSAKCQC